MKKLALALALLCCTTFAMADWIYGTAQFKGDKPTNGMSIGSVQVWYNGTLTHTSNNGGVEIWEGTGDICVVYPKNYNGPKLSFKTSNGSVQIHTLR